MPGYNLKAAKSIKFSHYVSNSGWITIYHPGHESENAPLFGLPVVDSATDGSKRGIHYGTLHTACAIVANNRFDGFLSREKSPSGVPLDIGIHDIVGEGRYYFHVPNVEDCEPYEVVSCPANWTFPHGDIPKLFLDLGNNRTTEIPTYTPPLSGMLCCLSARQTYTDVAYIVPASQSDWFGRNAMIQYLSTMTHGIDSPKNTLNIRRDLRLHWDEDHFALVPKANKDGKVVIVPHMLANEYPDLEDELHNQTTLIVTGGSRLAPFFLARFAYQIIKRTAGFYAPFAKRRIVIRGEGDKSAVPVWTESGEIKEVDEGVDPDNSDTDISCEEYYRNKGQWQDEVVVDNVKSPYELADEW